MSDDCLPLKSEAAISPKTPPRAPSSRPLGQATRRRALNRRHPPRLLGLLATHEDGGQRATGARNTEVTGPRFRGPARPCSRWPRSSASKRAALLPISPKTSCVRGGPRRSSVYATAKTAIPGIFHQMPMCASRADSYLPWWRRCERTQRSHLTPTTRRSPSCRCLPSSNETIQISLPDGWRGVGPQPYALQRACLLTSAWAYSRAGIEPRRDETALGDRNPVLRDAIASTGAIRARPARPTRRS